MGRKTREPARLATERYAMALGRKMASDRTLQSLCEPPGRRMASDHDLAIFAEDPERAFPQARTLARSKRTRRMTSIRGRETGIEGAAEGAA